jgi:enamine deaminase RidA (YjgF/YER057c/UK114 family)
MRDNVFPEGLARRVVAGNVLYSPVVTFDLGDFTMVMVSGLLSRNAEGVIIGPGDTRAQIGQVGENLRLCLRSVGAELTDLVQIRTYVTDIDEFFRHTDERQRFFGPALPASTTVEVARLANPDFTVEIDAMAIIPSSRKRAQKTAA